MDLKQTPFLKIATLHPDIVMETAADGSLRLHSRVALEAGPCRTTDRLPYWAEHCPERVFLAERDNEGHWNTLSYAKAWEKVQALAQFLLQSELSEDRPIAILSGNSMAHGLLALAAMHTGIPYAPVSPAYSLKSTDYTKLRHCLELLTPGLVFIEDEATFEPALKAVAEGLPRLSCSPVSSKTMHFGKALETRTGDAVDQAFGQITAQSTAKILFTSGSTGWPKGVINTHGNITTNWAQITQTFPFMKDGGLVLIDWLPWNHTFGGNHNFGLTLYNGGTLYIDGGNPTPGGIQATLENLRDIAPTVYFNVPKGFEELIPLLNADRTLREFFFSRLKMFFYAGASMPQHVWDGLEQMAYDTIGRRLLIATGLGMTEASPSALFNTEFGSSSGKLGVPVPGLQVKLVPDGDKWEACFKGGNISPGYWRNQEATRAAFDEDGYYKTGDALKLVDPDHPNKGMVFDGRISEDFKLDTGTWVRVGLLRKKLIEAGRGLVRDAVITGHDRSFVGAIVFPDLHYCQKLTGMSGGAALPALVQHPRLKGTLQETLNRLGTEATGSSTYISRAIYADFELDADKGEVTDKGSINQRAVLANRETVVKELYRDVVPKSVICYKIDQHVGKQG